MHLTGLLDLLAHLRSVYHDRIVNYSVRTKSKTS
jgi:hypothetical protein